MKKGIYAILTALTVFALVMTGCPTDEETTPVTTTYTVTFNLNGGSGTVPTSQTVTAGQAITLPPGTGLTGPSGRPNFLGWNTTTTATTALTSYTPTASGSLYAVWAAGPGGPTFPFELGDFTVTNNENQKGWATNGVDELTTNLEMDTLAAARYIVVETKGSSNRDGFGGVQIAFQGDGNNWAWKDVSLWGDWISFANTATDTVSIVIDLNALDADYANFIGGTQGKIFVCYYPLGNLGFQKATLTATANKPADAMDFTYGYITKEGGVQPGPVEVVEEISLGKAWFAIYEFTLPNDKKWSDYDAKLTATYKLDEDTFLHNPPRAVRAMGNYLPVEVANPTLGVYTPETGDPVNIATVGNWPGGTSNDWIFSQIASSWTAGAFPEALGPWTVPEDADIVADEWFTVYYPLDGSKKNGSWNRTGVRQPAAADAGPFYFGVGLPGENVNTWQVKNVTLIGKEGTADIVGKPLYYSKDGKNYRAIAGQLSDKDPETGICTNVNGGNPGWKIISGEEGIVVKPVTDVETVTVSFDLNYETEDNPPAAQVINKGGVLARNQLSPNVTRAGYTFKGWDTKADGTGIRTPLTGDTDTFMKFFTTDATYYAQWEVNSLPDATEDLVIDVSTYTFSTYGGLGSLNSDAGPGPFVYDNSYQYAAVVWIPLPAEAATANYDSIEITISAVEVDGETTGNPCKLEFHNGAGENSWGAGTTSWDDLTSGTPKTKSFSIAAPGITIQHNKGNASCNFNLTITAIKLIAPTP